MSKKDSRMIRKNSKSLLIHKKAEKAMREAVAKVVVEHRKSGIPLAIWKNGKVVLVQASQLPIAGR